jgi:exodeoxyribonuclease VII small subunit
MTKQKSEKKESQTYQSMLGELDELVRQVSQGQMDLDDIVGRVEHGYKLIATMRERLDATKTRVEKLRVDFESKEPKDGAITSTKKPNDHEPTSHSSSHHTDHDDDDDDDDDAPF